MLRFIIILLSFGFSASLNAQAYKDSVKAQFMRYTNLLMAKEFAKSADYMNADFFKIVPKQRLIEAIEKVYNNPSLDFKIKDPVIVSVGDNQLIGGSNFVKLQYSNYLLMHFPPSGDRVRDTALTTKTLGNQFGENNITYDSLTDTYKIFSLKDVIANSADNLKWTFIVVEEKQKPLLEKFIPKELL